MGDRSGRYPRDRDRDRDRRGRDGDRRAHDDRRAPNEVPRFTGRDDSRVNHEFSFEHSRQLPSDSYRPGNNDQRPSRAPPSGPRRGGRNAASRGRGGSYGRVNRDGRPFVFQAPVPAHERPILYFNTRQKTPELMAGMVPGSGNRFKEEVKGGGEEGGGEGEDLEGEGKERKPDTPMEMSDDEGGVGGEKVQMDKVEEETPEKTTDVISMIRAFKKQATSTRNAVAENDDFIPFSFGDEGVKQQSELGSESEPEREVGRKMRRTNGGHRIVDHGHYRNQNESDPKPSSTGGFSHRDAHDSRVNDKKPAQDVGPPSPLTTAPAPSGLPPPPGLGATLGSSLHDILTRLLLHPQAFPSISVIYDSTAPLSAPVVLLLDNNGLRLRFDGEDQRLRLIEVLDFQKIRLSYNGGELAKTGELAKAGTGSGAPTFRNIYNKLFGPTYPGEYIADQGVYVLSYPGVAFSFPVDKKVSKPASKTDGFVALLMGSNVHTASSMAIYNGLSWTDARDDLFTKTVTAPRSPGINGASARLSCANDETELVRLHDDNRVELIRRHNQPFWIILHLTTQQELVAELGPPCAIYRKNDHRLSIHRTRSMSGRGIQDDTDDTEPDDAQSDDDNDVSDVSASGNSDCFFNYFSHGIDIFISSSRSSSHPKATKIILHGNVPGSFEFQRYRRSRWTIELADSGEKNELKLHSEMMFDKALPMLRERFGEGQRPMLLNRGSDSPSSSCELLGGWEDGDKTNALAGGREPEAMLGNTELFGFPGFIFEVMKNRAISTLTVF